MPRRQSLEGRRQTPPAITAAARNYTDMGKSLAKKIERDPSKAEPFQHAAWDFYDLVPEFHQGCVIVGALLSRASLVVHENGEPTKNEKAKAALNEFFGGPEGHKEFLRQAGTHFTAAGDMWVFGPTDSSSIEWQVAATTSVAYRAGRWKVNQKQVDGKPLAMRLWLPHPRNPEKADPDVRSALTALSQIVQLDKRTSAQIDSRLTGAGLLLIPEETSFPSAPAEAMNPGDPSPRHTVAAEGASGLADLLFDAAQKSLADPESAAARLPIIGTAPGEFLSDVKLINFWSDLDRIASRTRKEKVDSLATALRIPAEVLLSSEGSNHWNMWLADENSAKIHGEPLLDILTGALTKAYLIPALEGEVEDPTAFSIKADTSKMRLRPNRSKEALEMNDRMLLSDEATLRETGFDAADKMDEEGVARALARKVARGSTTPELVEAALRKEGVALDVQVTDLRPPAEARPAPSLREHPTREIPARPASDPSMRASAAGSMHPLTFVAEQIVDRALQRAGNRIKTKFGIKNPPTAANRLYMAVELTPSDLDDVLTDAWSSCHEFDYGVDGSRLEHVLDVYVRSLARARREPSRTSISAALNLLPGDGR